MQKIMSMQGYSILSDKTEGRRLLPQHVMDEPELYFLSQMDDGP